MSQHATWCPTHSALETLNLHTAHTASGHWRSSHQTNFKITLQLQPCSKGSKLYCGMAYMTDQYPALEHVKPIKLNYDYAVSTDTLGQVSRAESSCLKAHLCFRLHCNLMQFRFRLSRCSTYCDG